eukprot:498666-Rhodomonas_salina.8
MVESVRTYRPQDHRRRRHHRHRHCFNIITSITTSTSASASASASATPSLPHKHQHQHQHQHQQQHHQHQQEEPRTCELIRVQKLLDRVRIQPDVLARSQHRRARRRAFSELKVAVVQPVDVLFRLTQPVPS